MYGDPFINLATGQRLRRFTAPHRGQTLFLPRIRWRWREWRSARRFGVTVSVPDPA